MYSHGSRERHFANGAIAAFVQHGRLGRQPLLRGCPVVPGGLAGYAQYIQIFSLIMPPQIANFQLHVCAMEAALADAELRDDPKRILDARNHFAEAKPCPTRYEPEQRPYFQAGMSLRR